MNHFFQMMSASAAAASMQSPEEPDTLNSANSPPTSIPLDLEAQPPTAGLSTPNTPGLGQPNSSRPNNKSSKRARELSVAGRDPKQRRLDTMFQ